MIHPSHSSTLAEEHKLPRGHFHENPKCVLTICCLRFLPPGWLHAARLLIYILFFNFSYIDWT